jgi:hypothetical protein
MAAGWLPDGCFGTAAPVRRPFGLRVYSGKLRLLLAAADLIRYGQ